MQVGVLFGLVALVGLALLAFHIWAIVDVLRFPEPVWQRAGQNQIVWLLVVLFLSFLGPVIYLLVARPQLLTADDS